MSQIVDIHSQFETHQLFNESYHLKLLDNFIGNELFTRQDYLRHNKEISTATASRDLKEAVDNEVIEKNGEKRLTKYRYKN